MKEKLERLLADLNYQEKDSLYRMLKSDYVRQDVIDRFEERGIDFLNNDELETVVRSYVYEGELDANLSYWTNLDILIDGVLELRKTPDNYSDFEPVEDDIDI